MTVHQYKNLSANRIKRPQLSFETVPHFNRSRFELTRLRILWHFKTELPTSKSCILFKVFMRYQSKSHLGKQLMTGARAISNKEIMFELYPFIEKLFLEKVTAIDLTSHQWYRNKLITFLTCIFIKKLRFQ